LSQAVRSAVDEVQKRAQEIREAQTPLIDQTLESLRELQDRNKTLSKLLSGALNELWEYQSLVATQHAVEHRTSSGSEPTEGFENTGPPSPGASAREATRVANVEKLSAAIAKVQFVQFYLDEPSLVLPEDEVRTDPGVKDSVSTEPQTQPEAPELSFTTAPQLISDTSGIASNSNAPVDLSGPKEGAIVNDGEEQPKQQTSSRESTEISGKGQASLSPNLVPSSSATATTTIPPAPTDLDGDRKPAVETAKSHSPRPSLEQSAFSFMLGQEKKPQPSRLHDSLFGGGGGGGSSSNTGLSGAKKDGSAEDPTQTNDEFDIGSLRRAKGRRT
jgi:TBC1 domain family protein 5